MDLAAVVLRLDHQGPGAEPVASDPLGQQPRKIAVSAGWARMGSPFASAVVSISPRMKLRAAQAEIRSCVEPRAERMNVSKNPKPPHPSLAGHVLLEREAIEAANRVIGGRLVGRLRKGLFAVASPIGVPDAEPGAERPQVVAELLGQGQIFDSGVPGVVVPTASEIVLGSQGPRTIPVGEARLAVVAGPGQDAEVGEQVYQRRVSGMPV